MAVTGARGAERCSRIWNIQVCFKWTFWFWDIRFKTGECLRILKLENNVRCLDFNHERLVTGDDDGYLVFWDMKACLNPSAGAGDLSYRSHNTYVVVCMVLFLYVKHHIHSTITGKWGKESSLQAWAMKLQYSKNILVQVLF